MNHQQIATALALLDQLIIDIEAYQKVGFGTTAITDINLTLYNINEVFGIPAADSDEERALACLDDIAFFETSFDDDCESAIISCHCAKQYLNGEFSE